MYGPASPETKTFCELELQVEGRNVLDVNDKRSRSTRESVRVSAYPLACWLAENFFRLLYEPTRGGGTQSLPFMMAHDLPSIGYGFVWPKLRISGDGRSVSFCFENSTWEDLSPITIRSRISEKWFGLNDAQSAIDDFVNSVLMRLRDCEIEDEYLPSLWNSVLEERLDAQILGVRRIEALLGLEPDTDSQIVERWKYIEEKIGKAVLDLAGVVDPEDAEDMLRLLGNQEPMGRGELPRLASELGQLSDPVAWQLGRNAAVRVREIMANEENNLSEIPFLPESPATGQMTASRTDEDSFRMVMRQSHHKTQRFERARILGDLLLFPSERFSVVSQAHTYRQKVQRSFAAELLLPTLALKKRAADGYNFQDDEMIMRIADEFSVSERVVWRQLENRGFLSTSSGLESTATTM